MKGNIHIKGDLYITDGFDVEKLSYSGLTIIVEGDIISIPYEPKNLNKDDVFIEDLFNKLKIEDLIII